jgi:hypothetical protein
MSDVKVREKRRIGRRKERRRGKEKERIISLPKSSRKENKGTREADDTTSLSPLLANKSE